MLVAGGLSLLTPYVICSFNDFFFEIIKMDAANHSHFIMKKSSLDACITGTIELTAEFGMTVFSNECRLSARSIVLERDKDRC